MHELEVHHIGLKIGDGIGQLCKSWLERVQGKWFAPTE